MIKLIEKSEKIFFQGDLHPKNLFDLVRQIFPKKYQNSMVFRVLLFFPKEHRKKHIMVKKSKIKNLFTLPFSVAVPFPYRPRLYGTHRSTKKGRCPKASLTVLRRP